MNLNVKEQGATCLDVVFELLQSPLPKLARALNFCLGLTKVFSWEAHHGTTELGIRMRGNTSRPDWLTPWILHYHPGSLFLLVSPQVPWTVPQVHDAAPTSMARHPEQPNSVDPKAMFPLGTPCQDATSPGYDLELAMPDIGLVSGQVGCEHSADQCSHSPHSFGLFYCRVCV